MFSLVDGISIQIGGRKPITIVHEVEIESAWAKFTDTATITLPRNLNVLHAGISTPLPDLISVGDTVEIKYGYDGQLRTEFTGYVSELKPGTPFQIKCEDQMWALKRQTLKSKSWHSVTLREVLTYIRDQSSLTFEIRELGKLDVGKYMIDRATGAQVFDNLKKLFGLNCFFRDGVLVAGKPYDRATAKTHAYGFRQNIIDSDLAYINAADVALHFRATSTQPDGKKVQVDASGVVKTNKVKGDNTARVTALSAGISKGELRTLIGPPGLTAAQLLKWVELEAGRLRFDGYRGGLTSFNLPTAEHGDIATITDPDYPERAGSYYIDSVSKTFGVNGSRRKLKLGPRA
ncbi:hypothetical protein Q5H93_21765 [Hymenobacter sp. ASUV-10]|uniref:Phage late control D family protein n=1 Tax=Hymenobacter aranciens TaxID=3063996 RepID=A0ABT9BGJ4_9BACT|nr:hypothetical protein [Hymenobacter sp. ASUV-10]MDO7877384.1 hypothetical protein [Hymenobacter sp. ASUV-10]